MSQGVSPLPLTLNNLSLYLTLEKLTLCLSSTSPTSAASIHFSGRTHSRATRLSHRSSGDAQRD